MFYIVNFMAADDQAPQGARTSNIDGFDLDFLEYSGLASRSDSFETGAKTSFT